MKSFAALAAVIALASQASALTVNSLNNVVTCEPVMITWSQDGTAPFFLSLIPGNDPTAAALKQFPQINSGTSFTWNVDLPAGTTFTISLKDSTGTNVFSSAIPITDSGNDGCINTSVQDNGSVTAGSGSPTSGGSTPASTTGSSGSSATTTGSSASKTSGTSSAASGTATHNAASRGTSVGAFGIAGLMGLIGAALF